MREEKEQNCIQKEEDPDAELKEMLRELNSSVKELIDNFMESS